MIASNLNRHFLVVLLSLDPQLLVILQNPTMILLQQTLTVIKLGTTTALAPPMDQQPPAVIKHPDACVTSILLTRQNRYFYGMHVV